MRNRAIASMLAILVILAMPLTIAAAAPGTTSLASVKLFGESSRGESLGPQMSKDARYIVYDSTVADLVARDTNGRRDVFLFDRQEGVTERLSVSGDGTQGNADSISPRISDDGRYVIFTSFADNLVAGDTNGDQDVFLRDRATGTIERISVSTQGAQGNSRSYGDALTPDGRYIVFDSEASNMVAGDANAAPDTFIRDRVRGTTERVSLGNNAAEGNASSRRGAISADGRYVAFASLASNFVPGMPTGIYIFVRDRQAGTTQLVSVAANGSPASTVEFFTMSADGRYVAFDSWMHELVPGDTNSKSDVYVRDRVLGFTERVSVTSTGAQGADGGGFDDHGSSRSSISRDGRYISFISSSRLVPEDTDTAYDMYLRDRVAHTTERIGTEGETGRSAGQSFSSISADGRYVAFEISGRIFIGDRQASTSAMIPLGNSVTGGGDSKTDRSLSADGRYTAFASPAKLVAGTSDGLYPDVFVQDAQTHIIEVASVGRDGEPANAESFYPAINASGRYVAFASFASNLVGPGNLDYISDIYLRDRDTRSTELISVNTSGGEGDGTSWYAAISADGRFVAFASEADNLVSGDTNQMFDVFVRDRRLGTTRRVSVSSTGEQSNGDSIGLAISADGRYVAFDSWASNLVANDTNGGTDVFVHDLQTGSTVRASVTDSAAQATGQSFGPSISANGRYLAFSTSAANLVDGASGASLQVVVRDLVSRSTEAIGIGPDGGRIAAGTMEPSISADGRYVAFTSLDDLLPDGCHCIESIFVRDRQARTTARVSVNSRGEPADLSSRAPAISGDGKYVAFTSVATNLVDGDFNSADDVFVRERAANDTFAARVNAGGGAFTDSQGRLWSADTGFNTGSVAISSAAIAGTNDDSLYQSIRWDDSPQPELQYSFTVPNGDYQVKLHFSESNPGTAYVGGRVFDVDMEGTARFTNLDVFAAAGSIDRAVIKSANVTVSDGQLNIRFRHRVKNPIVSAIEIVARESSSSPVAIRTNAGGGEYLDSQGRTWSADAGFNSGEPSLSTTPIAGTDDDSLFQSIRWDDSPAPELRYDYVLPNGIYRVNLYFAEANPKTAYVGARVFDVDIQGYQRFDNVDVFAEAGGIQRALIKSTTVTVSNGRLDILFRHQVKNPIVSAIEIVGQ
ncbi:MAG: malectin domain-containing carbohydrate-binding protein [Steroidobacteraceae bacterium]